MAARKLNVVLLKMIFLLFNEMFFKQMDSTTYLAIQSRIN